MKMTKLQSTTLKKALIDKKDIIYSMQNGLEEFDDEQLEKLNRFKQLNPLEQDLLILTSKYKIKDVAKMYQVSTGYISILLRQIKDKLQ